MKNFVLLLVIFSVFLFVGQVKAYAATYYVDGGCSFNGDGSSVSCASQNGAPGAINTIGGFSPDESKNGYPTGFAKIGQPGDVLMIRGIHGSFDGRYHADTFRLSGKNGTAVNPITIQPYGYTGPGTGETVYIEGTHAPNDAGAPNYGWIQCVTNAAGSPCAGVPAPVGEVWYATDSGQRAIFAQKPDGAPTYRVVNVSDLTNQYYSYNAGIWNSTSTSYSAGTREEVGSTIFVRWGTTLPNKPYIGYTANASGFDIGGYGNSSSYIVIRGFVFRTHGRTGINITPPDQTKDHLPVTHITIIDNKIFYNGYVFSSGPDYGIAEYSGNDITIENNEIAYTTSEGIHSEAAFDPATGAPVPTRLIIRGNWIHDIGDQSVMGPYTKGTPEGLILGERGGLSGAGDYTGSVVENNLIQRAGTAVIYDPVGDLKGKGIIVENNSYNWIIRDNIIQDTTDACIRLITSGVAGVSVSNNQIYNNIFMRCGQAGWGAILLRNSGAGTYVNNNQIYNNTFVNNPYFDIDNENGSAGGQTGNAFRNNIFYKNTNWKSVNYILSSTGAFQNNVVHYTTGYTGTAVSFGSNNFTCAQIATSTNIDGAGAGNNKCVNPNFVNAGNNDFHLAAGSPAVDAGTSTGMPAGRSADIRNTLASSYGFPSYADHDIVSGSAWDVGVDERPRSVYYPTANTPPTANAGPDVSTTVGTAVTLSGSGTDAEGMIALYDWSVAPAGCTLQNQSTETLTVICNAAGTYTSTFTVIDDQGATGSDSALIAVVADATAPTAPTGLTASYVASAKIEQNLALLRAQLARLLQMLEQILNAFRRQLNQ